MGRPKNFSREEVLQKAIPIFWKQGFADTSLQDLEAATGVNKSGLYSEFEDKEDLFLASLRHYLDSRGGKQILLAEPLGWDNVERFLRLIQNCSADLKGCFAINSMREIAILPQEASDLVAKNQAQLKRWVIKNIAAEQTNLQPEAIAEIVMTFFTGLCLEQNLKVSKSTSSKKIDDVMKALRSL